MINKNLIVCLTSLFLLAVVSCTDESIVNETNELRVMGGISANSRTTFVHGEESTKTHWETNDAIGLYTDSQQNIPYKAVSGGSSHTEFTPAEDKTIEAGENKEVTAYYPYSSNAEGDEVPLPHTVGLYADRPVPAFLLGEGTANGQEVSLKFNHAFAYLKITFGGNLYNSLCEKSFSSLENGILFIKANNPISVRQATYNLKTKAITHLDDENNYIMHFLKNKEYKNNQKYTYFIPILPQPAYKRISLYFDYPMKGKDYSYIRKEVANKSTPKEGFQAGKVYVLDFTQTQSTGDWPQMEALTEFYESTNGVAWNYKDNWLTQEPLENWYGVNTNDPWNKYVITMNLPRNNLTGSLPESFATLMENATEINLSMNHLEGTIPDAVKTHRNWNKLGWQIVPQDTRKGGGFDLSNSNLTLTEATLTKLEDNSSLSLKEIFSRNRLTQVIAIHANSIETVMNAFTADRVNLHLDYQPKGMETIIFTGRNMYADNTQLIADIQKRYGSVAGIHWLCSLPIFTIYYNMTYLFDSSGQLVHIAPYLSNAENESVHSAYAAVLESYLDRPTRHDPFDFGFYTSTDYSQHGKTFTMQHASEGKGIDLVFIGEGFVDKDMEPGGKYETKMKQAADKLFELEPYKSLRNRFNLYGVKVVSPTAEFVSGAGKSINEDNEKAFELAAQYNPNLPENANMRVVVVYNAESNIGRSYCVMYSSGDFVTYIMDKLDNTLIHEVGGHGIARLTDEYVEQGYENISLPEKEKETLDEALTWDWGWFANVDYHNTVSTVRWSRFLNDSRYAHDNLGIYEGAYLFGKGVYRPSDDSMMRHNISWFNAPSREAIYKAVMTLSEGDSWKYDYEEFVAFDSKNIGTTQSRSVTGRPSAEEIREVRTNHRKPVLVRGSWRDEIRKAKSRITVPWR